MEVELLVISLSNFHRIAIVNWANVLYLKYLCFTEFLDDYDKRLLLTFCKIWLCDAILQDGFQFSDSYTIPKLKNLDDYVRYIEDNLPVNEDPGVYGLHRNAGIT